jgi:hypothetical protein
MIILFGLAKSVTAKSSGHCLRHFSRWIYKIPTITDLANASEKDVYPIGRAWLLL